MKTLVLSPVYEDDAVYELLQDIAALGDTNISVLLVDDGSLTNPVDSRRFSHTDLEVRIIRLQRNLGHQGAIALGLNYAVDNLTFDNILIMDCDGEDKPSSIPELLNELHSSQADIVVAKRKSRFESVKFKVFYWLYKRFFKLLVGREISFGNFMVLKQSAAQRIRNMKELWTHLAATALKSKLSISLVGIDRGRRYCGESKMNMISLTLHGLGAIMVFTESVLVRITLFCAFFAALISVTLFFMVLFKITGLAIPGWFSTIVGILVLMLTQIATLALLILLLAGKLRETPSQTHDYSSLIASVEHDN